MHMRLVFLTQHYPPEMGAAAARLFELTKKLAALGHTVQVITALPNYPTGRIFDGYRGKLRMVDEVEGVRVIRTWLYPDNSSRLLPRALNYLSFATSSLLLAPWRLGRQDVVLFDTPPLSLVPVGLAIGQITGARVIMNVADLWPDVAVRLGYPVGRFSLRLLRLLERVGYQRSDVVSVTTPAARRQIRERFPSVETTVIRNGADLDLFRPSLRSQAVRTSLGAGPNDFLVGYCGLHGLFQGLEVIVEAAARLLDHPHIKFVLVGDGPIKERLVELARQRQLSNVRFEPPVPRTDIPAILASCDAGLVPLATEFPGTMPSKVYEILASGVPLVVSKGCEGETLVTRFNVGRTFRPRDHDDLVAVLVDLASHCRELAQMRQHCLDLAKHFDRETVLLQTEAILRAVAEGNPLPQVSCQMP